MKSLYNLMSVNREYQVRPVTVLLTPLVLGLYETAESDYIEHRFTGERQSPIIPMQAREHGSRVKAKKIKR